MIRRRNRRLLVLVTLALVTLLGSALPGSLRGLGIVPTLALTVVGAVLVRATGGLAFARGRRLDERQAQRRDRAHRRGFRLLGLAVVLLLVVWSVSTGIATGSGHDTFSQLDNGLAARVIVALLGLVVMMPTLVLAWTEPDAVEETGAKPAPLRPLLAVPAIAAAWLLAVVAAPAQTAAASGDVSVGGLTVTGLSCRHVATGRVIGAQFGATVGLRAEVCWNGRQAFIVGDPSTPPPAGAIPNDVLPPFAEPDLTACGADSRDDFAAVTGIRCTATTDPRGTLHYTVHARVAPLPLGIAARDVALSLVVARDGTVLEVP
ncbi:MAG TPA: hypothetical protein VGL20_18745 [Candidatus Dormibacteraeota bacterium]|jgi:membrane protease YdiL (CAAX protease family)